MITISDPKLYDQLKKLAQVGLPALGALYFALGMIWGFPATEQVLGTIAAIDTFLGAVLGISSKAYYENADNFDGELLVDVGAPGPNPDLVTVLNEHPDSFKDRKTVTFATRVIDTSPQKPSEGR